jgi:hypothetical protein
MNREREIDMCMYVCVYIYYNVYVCIGVEDKRALIFTMSSLLNFAQEAKKVFFLILYIYMYIIL